jgi:hypothetical protein
VWGSLKARSQAHDELIVRLCHCEVQKGANHALVLTLVNSLTILIWTQRHSHAHRTRDGLELSHVELLYQVLHILVLVYKGTIDVSYAAPQAYEIVNVALHQEYSPGIVFIFFQGRKDLYHV